MHVSNHVVWQKPSSATATEDSSGLLQYLQEQHGKRWPDLDSRPPWIVICTEILSTSGESQESVSGLMVTFALHHAVGDGLSAVVFHRQLLNALNQRLSSNDPEDWNERDNIIPTENALSIPQPIEKLASWTLSWTFFLGVLWNEFAPSSPFRKKVQPAWSGTVITPTPNKVSFRLLQVAASDVRGVLSACRSHGVTLTPLIHAIVLYSLVKHLPEEPANNLLAQTAIDTRRWLNLPEKALQAFGNYNCSWEFPIGPSMFSRLKSVAAAPEQAEAEIWAVAAFVKADLQARLRVLPRNDGIGLLPYVGDWRQRWLRMVGQPRKILWEVSNLGSHSGQPTLTEGDEPASCEIKSSVLTQSANVGGPAFSVNISSIKDGALSITLSWQESVVENDLMDAVEQDLRTWTAKFRDEW
jgi:hypothetical protein